MLVKLMESLEKYFSEYYILFYINEDMIVCSQWWHFTSFDLGLFGGICKTFGVHLGDLHMTAYCLGGFCGAFWCHPSDLVVN